MTDVDIDYLKSWIGRERSITDIITPRLASSLNAVLDIDKPVAPGKPAPVGIHWCLAPDIAPMSQIGPDGHPARGSFLPPVPFPRRMWAGGELTFSDDFRIGDEVVRRSTIEDVVLKTGRSGEMIFVTVRHRYSTPRGEALDERQDLVFRKLEAAGSGGQPAAATPPQTAVHTRKIEANPVLLFRYSAITFNGHRIHYDEPYVKNEENYPGLIFHGPLQANLLLDLATELRNGEVPQNFAFRSVHPLFAGGRISLNARPQESGTSLWVADQAGGVTMIANC